MFDYQINDKIVQFVLITRRSQNFAGTRYNTRGINDDGNVANYCESEHILYMSKNNDFRKLHLIHILNLRNFVEFLNFKKISFPKCFRKKI